MSKNIFTESELKYIQEKEFKDSYLQYIKMGLSILPVCSDGKPAISDWEKYKKNRMDANEAEMHFNPSTHSIGIICGKVSANLEVIVINNELYNDLLQGMTEYFGSRAESFATSKLGSDKVCLFYFCKQIENGQILLERAIKGGKEICIESKGEGDIVMAPTSIDKGWYAIPGINIKEITPAERSKIFSIARDLANN